MSAPTAEDKPDEVSQTDSQQAQSRDINEQLVQPREHLISTAVKFLQSSAVVGSSLKDKQEFLLKKGLTAAELSEALIRAQSEMEERHRGTVTARSGSRLRNWSLLAILFGGALYTCYKLYKDYIVPFLANEKSETETLNQRLTENTEALTAFRERIDQLQQTCERNTQKVDQLQTASRGSNSSEIRELKDELSSLKKLLLNRHQFPETPVVKPVIPAWQLEEAGQAQPSTNSNNSDQLNSTEGGMHTPPDSSISADGAHANLEDQHLDQNGVSDSDTESMTEQVDQSMAVNGSFTEQEQTTADSASPPKAGGVVSSGHSGDVSS